MLQLVPPKPRINLRTSFSMFSKPMSTPTPSRPRSLAPAGPAANQTIPQEPVPRISQRAGFRETLMAKRQSREVGSGFHQRPEKVKPSKRGVTPSTGVQNARVGAPLTARLDTLAERNLAPTDLLANAGAWYCAATENTSSKPDCYSCTISNGLCRSCALKAISKQIPLLLWSPSAPATWGPSASSSTN